MMVEVGFQLIPKMVFIPLVYKRLVNIEEALVKILGLRKNFYVVGKAQADKLADVQIGSRWLPI